MAGAPFGADVADRHPTHVGGVRSVQTAAWVGDHKALLGRDGVALGQVQRRMAVDARLIQREPAAGRGGNGVEGPRAGIGFPGRGLLIQVNEVLAILIHVQVLLLGLPFVLEGGGLQVIVVILPGVGGRLPVYGDPCQIDGVGEGGAVLDLVPHRGAQFRPDEDVIKAAEDQAVTALQVHHDRRAVDEPVDQVGYRA